MGARSVCGKTTQTGGYHAAFFVVLGDAAQPLRCTRRCGDRAPLETRPPDKTVALFDKFAKSLPLEEAHSVSSNDDLGKS
jgi:hypothetical protein